MGNATPLAGVAGSSSWQPLQSGCWPTHLDGRVQVHWARSKCVHQPAAQEGVQVEQVSQRQHRQQLKGQPLC